MNAITFCPTSCQLKLAVCRRKSNFAFSLPLTYRRNAKFLVVRVRGNAVNGNDLEQRSPENSSWVKVKSSSDGFSGWANDGVERSSGDSKKKQSLIGILGAGVVGVIVFSGLTFFIVTLTSRGASRVKDPMVPLTLQQEEALSSSNSQNHTENDREGEVAVTLGNGNGESEECSDKDRALSRENARLSEIRTEDYADVRQSFENGDDFVLKSNEGESSQSFGSSEISDEPRMTDNGYDSLAPPDLQNSFNTVASENSSELAVGTNLENVATCYPDGVSMNNDERSNFSSDSSDLTPSVSDIEVKNNVAVFVSKTIGSDTNESGSGPLISDVEQTESLYIPVEQNLSGELQESVNLLQEQSLENDYNDLSAGPDLFGATSFVKFSPSAGIPAPSSVSSSLQVPPGKILVPAVVDELQSQALSALQILKVIEDDVKPGDLCSRREYARWLVLASSVLSRSVSSKVYPAMYIENSSEIAFDDITPEDPDFQSIQGLAEAGLIASKLSRRDLQQNDLEDTSPVYFSPESHLSRQDLVTWRMALDKKQLPIVDQKTLQQISGFIDISKIHPDAWPALVADLSSSEQSIIALAFGYTKLFQPGKPVTKGQAAIALSTGEAYAIVSEELTRIEAESMAENAVSAHSALVAQVEIELNENYEKELLIEREKNNAVHKLAEDAKREVENLRALREEENLTLVKERAAIDSEMEILSRLRRDVEEQLQAVMADKLEISYEKERLNKLRRKAEDENQDITRLQYELEVERKALSMAREWAEEEAKRARDQAKALDEARNTWRNKGIKVMVDKDLVDEAEASVTWLGNTEPGEELTVEERAGNLIEKIERMGYGVGAKVKDTLTRIIEIIVLFISNVKKQGVEIQEGTKSRLRNSVDYLQDESIALTFAVKENVKRISEECKEGIERLTQKFKT